MKNINRGDSLYFKPNPTKENRLEILKTIPDGTEFEILSYNGTHITIKLNKRDLHFSILHDAYYYIWDWFYTKAELRDKRINQILEDEF